MERIGTYIKRYVKGKTPKVLIDEKTEGVLPYLSPDYLRGKCPPEQYAECVGNAVFVKDGEVIVLWDGSNAGEIFISKNGILASTMTLLEINEQELYKKYFGYTFQNLEYILKAKTAGSGIPHADKGIINSLEFYKPNKSEQIVIANILSKVDEAIVSVQNSIAAAERLKKSLMQNLLTGKMKPDGTFRTPEEFYIDEKFGKVPVGWEVKRGSEITNKITKGQSPKWQGFDYQQEGILFVTSENIQNGYIDITKPKYLSFEFNNKIKNSQLKKSDILINIVGASIGRCAIFDIDIECANTNQAVCVFRPNAENDSLFLSLYLQDETTQNRLFRTQVETARANLSLGDFRKFKFVIPKKEEQICIANRINLFNMEIEKQVEKNNILERLKKSLTQNLLTGKVRIDVEQVNNQIVV